MVPPARLLDGERQRVAGRLAASGGISHQIDLDDVVAARGIVTLVPLPSIELL